KAVRQLDPAEQEEVLGELLTAGTAPWLVTTMEQQLTRRLTWLTPGHNRAELAERVSTLVTGPGDLKMLPVRLPAADYERLRTWSREHGFSMAVIIRTLVERFLDGQAQGTRPASSSA